MSDELIAQKIKSNKKRFSDYAIELSEGYMKEKMPMVAFPERPRGPDLGDKKYEIIVQTADGTVATRDWLLYEAHEAEYEQNVERWEDEMEALEEKNLAIQEGARNVHNFLFDQCSEQLQSVLEQQNKWNKISSARDPFKLRPLIRRVMLNFHTNGDKDEELVAVSAEEVSGKSKPTLEAVPVEDVSARSKHELVAVPLEYVSKESELTPEAVPVEDISAESKLEAGQVVVSEP